MARGSSEQNGSGKIGVLLASASAVRRAGLETIIQSAPSLKLVGSVQGTQTASQRAVQSRADVLLMDLESRSFLPTESQRSTPAIVLVDQPEPGWLAHALRSGVKAVLARDSGADEIIPAIMAAYSGFVFLDPAYAAGMAEQVRVPSARADAMAEHLTPRELEILAMLADGLANREIASRLGVSDHTVKYHISSILDKLGAATRTEAVTLGLRLGLILL
jgi:DNA-binding NarL/FixJ family response regulator